MIEQGNTLRFRELRVQPEHFDCEAYLVDDSLAGAMPTGEQFQVRDVVIKPITVNVMDSFLREQFSPNLLLHDVSVFEDFVGRRAILGGDAQQGVFSFNASRYLRQAMFFAVDFAYPLVFALLRANSLFVVKIAAARAARSVAFFTAVFACEFVSLVGIFPSAVRGAWQRAVQRIFTVLFSILFYLARFVKERLAAFLALEFHVRHLCRDTSMQSFVCFFAFKIAKALRAMRKFNAEQAGTLFASFLDAFRQLAHGSLRLTDGNSLASAGSLVK
jgi:hypothetical protein